MNPRILDCPKCGKKQCYQRILYQDKSLGVPMSQVAYLCTECGYSADEFNENKNLTEQAEKLRRILSQAGKFF